MCRQVVLGICVIAFAVSADAGTLSFRNFDAYGGSWEDANKSIANKNDDLMCWAGAGSNILSWTGWGKVAGMTSADNNFKYFQDHFTDSGGLIQFGWEWWFSGKNQGAGWGNFSQVTQSGGAFYQNENFNSYYRHEGNDSAAMSAIASMLRGGYGVAMGVYGPGGHALTVWGYDYDSTDPTKYTGLWITDSDDNMWTGEKALRHYDVKYIDGRWYLQNLYGSNDWYIGDVEGLARMSGDVMATYAEGQPLAAVPLPPVVWAGLSMLGGLGVWRWKSR